MYGCVWLVVVVVAACVSIGCRLLLKYQAPIDFLKGRDKMVLLLYAEFYLLSLVINQTEAMLLNLSLGYNVLCVCNFCLFPFFRSQVSTSGAESKGRVGDVFEIYLYSCGMCVVGLFCSELLTKY